MKRLYYCLGSIVVLGLIFSGCYYFSYKQALTHFNQRAKQVDPYFLLEERKQDTGKEENATPEPEIRKADTTKPETVLPSTKYLLERYDVSTKQSAEENRAVPEDFLGMTREEIILYLSEYMEHLPLEEQQDGLLSYELISFSKDQVVFRKTYNPEAVPYKYYMAVREGMVVVYYCDKKTVYEYTGIACFELPEEEQRKLMDGIEVKDDQELYGILETYSS